MNHFSGGIQKSAELFFFTREKVKICNFFPRKLKNNSARILNPLEND